MKVSGWSWLACLPVLFMSVAHAGMGPTIRVEGDGWGRVDNSEIQAVLESVAEQLISRPSLNLSRSIVVTHGIGSPVTLYGKGAGGAYQVHLSASGRRWALYAYQFGHELCHIMSNFEAHAAIQSPNQWFEEALCEAAGLHALRGMAASWSAEPPYPAWSEYAPAFRDYADRLAAESHRRLPADATPQAWLRQHMDGLRADPYRRESNEVIAMQLLPLFESAPGNWASLYALNGKGAATMNFADYLRRWHTDAPAEDRNFIAGILAMLTIPAEAPLSRELPGNIQATITTPLPDRSRTSD